MLEAGCGGNGRHCGSPLGFADQPVRDLNKSSVVVAVLKDQRLFSSSSPRVRCAFQASSRLLVALVGCLLVPHDRFGKALFDAVPLIVTVSQVVLGRYIAALGSLHELLHWVNKL